MSQSVIFWNLHINLIRKHQSNYSFVLSCLFIKNSEKVMFPATGQYLSYTKIWDSPLPILRCFLAAPKVLCPEFSLKSIYMNIFYFILDYFVLYPFFSSCLSAPVHKDVALTTGRPHVLRPNLPWNTMVLLLLFYVKTTTHIQVQGMLQMNQDKIIYSCIHFIRITSPLDDFLLLNSNQICE